MQINTTHSTGLYRILRSNCCTQSIPACSSSRNPAFQEEKEFRVCLLFFAAVYTHIILCETLNIRVDFFECCRADFGIEFNRQRENFAAIEFEHRKTEQLSIRFMYINS